MHVIAVLCVGKRDYIYIFIYSFSKIKGIQFNHTFIHSYIHTSYIYIYKYMCVYMYTCIYICICIHTHTHIYIYNIVGCHDSATRTPCRPRHRICLDGENGV